MEKDITARENIYLDLLEQLAREDLKEKAAAKDLQIQSDGKLLVPSFARNYLVDGSGVTPADTGPLSFQQRLAVVGYLLSAGTGEPAYEYVPLGHLEGFNIGKDRHETKNLKQPIIQRFGDDYARFAEAALKIGGIERESRTSGKHVWVFHVFPKIPIQLIFYEGTSEFPADVQVLFDKKALEFMGFTCLGFLPGYFVENLLEAAFPLSKHE